MFAMILSLSLFVYPVFAQDGNNIVASPAPITRAAMTNRSGLFARDPAFVVGHDEYGCPTVTTFGPQYMGVKDIAVTVGAATDARTRCIQARAAKTASDRGAEAKYSATLLAADASAAAVKAAAARGESTYSVIDADDGHYVTATGTAASLAAAGGSFGGGAIGGLSPWVTQGAMDMVALRAINGGGSNPPVTASKTTTPSSSSSPPSSPQAAVRDAEDEARSAARAAGVTPPR